MQLFEQPSRLTISFVLYVKVGEGHGRTIVKRTARSCLLAFQLSEQFAVYFPYATPVLGN
jgi:hypothetical protein